MADGKLTVKLALDATEFHAEIERAKKALLELEALQKRVLRG